MNVRFCRALKQLGAYLSGALVSGAAVAACGLCHKAVPIVRPPASHVIHVDDNESAAGRVEPAALMHVMRGLFFLGVGKAAQAVPHLRLALIYDSHSPFIHSRLSLALAATGRHEQALEVLAQGLAHRPKDPWLNALAGANEVVARRFVAALEYFAVAVAEPALHGDVYPQWVDALLWLGRQQEAWRLATAALGHSSDNVSLPVDFAVVFEDHGHLGWAQKLYAKAQRHRPHERLAVLGEIRVLDLAGKAHLAADVLASLFAYAPDDLELYVLITRLYRRAGSADAQKFRDEALRQSEAFADGRFLLALGDLMEGADHDGEHILTTLLAEHPHYWGARLALAELALQRGDGRRCVEFLSDAGSFSLSAGQPNLAALSLRARCYAARGDMARALVDFETMLKGGAPREQVLQETAEVLVRSAESFAAADKHFAAVLDRWGIDADDVSAQLGKVLLWDYFGKGQEAIAAMEMLLQAGHDRLDGLLRWADLQARHGQAQQALEALHGALQRHPDDPTCQNALGFILLEMSGAAEPLPQADESWPDKLRHAAVLIRRAYRQAGEHAYIVDSLGWLLFRQGKHEDARRLLMRANWLAPLDSEILFHLGEVQRAMGNNEAAREAYERALRQSPALHLRTTLQNRLRQP